MITILWKIIIIIYIIIIIKIIIMEKGQTQWLRKEIAISWLYDSIFFHQCFANDLNFLP